ncbi:hypothetical protein F9C07_7281 [Aspergillus flavus]|uniref:Uncharacterized protein n=1 Tax=Aspergillus flavus (strain ATCC 200026 / FGSC A1120 / IAM 13836 / NRRL 3357 / JCM 12722 / SRRC 167) TaxID=332952 RepID=A0A7U2MMJ8_ASPFN|nr:hypothetical protein F9C07_7281 [Aspergillus flavus]
MRVFATRHSDWFATVGDFPAMSQRLVIVTGSGGVQNSEPSKCMHLMRPNTCFPI